MVSSERFINVLKYVEVLGLIITLALLPLDRLPYIDKIPFNLGLISAIFLFAATLTRLGIVLKQKRFADFKRYFFVGCLLILPVVGYGLSTAYAIDRDFALGATVILAAVTARAFSFFVLISETPAYWRLVKKTIYVLTAVVVAYGFFQFFFDVWGAPTNVTELRRCCTSNSTYVFPRVHSTALEPLYFDHFLMIPLWLLTFDFLKNKLFRKDRRRVILFTLTATLFILTIARSATIGLIIAGIIFYFGARKISNFKYYLKFMAKAWGAAVTAAILLILMSGIAAMFIDKTAQYANRGAGSLSLFGSHYVDFDDGSARTRYDLWPKSIDYIQEEPLTGVGADNSRIRLNMEAYDKGAPIEKLQPFNNDLIGLVVDLGAIALFAFGPLVAAVVYSLYRMFKKAWAFTVAPMGLALVGMLIQGNFFHSLLLTRTWVVIGLVLVMLGPAKGILRANNANSH